MLLELVTKKVFVSRDAHFFEIIFPFPTLQSDSQSIFSVPNFIPETSVEPPISSTAPMSSPTTSSFPERFSSPTPYIPPLSPDPISNHTPEIRKSHRVNKRPTYLNDYICNHVYFSNVSDSYFVQPVDSPTFAFEAMSLQNQHLLGSISAITEPTSFK